MAAAGGSFGLSAVWRGLPTHLAAQALSFLPPNEIACTGRLVCKAAAALLRGPAHATVRTSRAVPPHAFARWARPDSAHALTYAQRLALSCAAAAGGVRALQALAAGPGLVAAPRVLEAAAAAGDLDACAWLRQQGFPWHTRTEALRCPPLAAAARGGHLHVCHWLRAAGCPWDASVLSAAAGSGQLSLVRWLLASRCPHDPGAPAAAARGGHAHVADWLLEALPDLYGDVGTAVQVLVAAAHGCDLHALRRLHGKVGLLQGHSQPRLPSEQQALLVAAAAYSPTPDWRDKVDWLRSKGCVSWSWDCPQGVRQPVEEHAAALERLFWLRARGVPLWPTTLLHAAGGGHTETLRFLLRPGQLAGQLDREVYQQVAEAAAEGGHAEALEMVLLTHGSVDTTQVAAVAASKGHMPVVARLVETAPAGGATILSSDATAAAAASSGSLELLAWLRGRGCRMGPSTCSAAAQAGKVEALAWLRARCCAWDWHAALSAASGGCVAALEWLAEGGCPAPPREECGRAYMQAAARGDLATLACMRRLGWSWGGASIQRAVRGHCSLPVLRWLHGEGCPVFWAKAASAAAACRRGERDVVAWVTAKGR